MKQCINNLCKAELEDYIERCPTCGRLQKQFNMPAKEKRTTESLVVQERNGFITFWLWTIIIGNLLMAIISFFPKTMWGKGFPDDYVIWSIISGLFSIVNIAGAFMLFAWKRNGFYIVALSAICGGLIAYFAIGAIPVSIVGLFILWLILKMKKKGKSYWECLD